MQSLDSLLDNKIIFIFYKACYGIVQVPKGPWFCRKCESQERIARVVIIGAWVILGILRLLV